MSAETINYGGKSIATLQVTTGLYPSTADPLDTRERIASPDVLTSNAPVGCRLYTGLRIYIESTKETVTCLGLLSGADGSKWNHWKFDRVIDAFRDAIDDCRNIEHQGRYDLVEPGVYTTQNLLNYLFLRCNGDIIATHRLTITYKYSASGATAAQSYVVQVPEGGSYSVVSPTIPGYQPDQEVVNGTMGSSDVDIAVTYTSVAYTLTYKKFTTDTVPYAEYMVGYGSVVSPPSDPVYPDETHVFSHWDYYPNLLSGGTMPASDVIAIAAWDYIPQQYVVSLQCVPTVGGTATGAGTYNEGSTVNLIATPEENYSFVNWTENGLALSTSPTHTLYNLASNRDIVANFVATRVTITVGVSTEPKDETGGTASVSGDGTFSVGEQATLTATVNPGYKFKGWYEESTSQLISSSVQCTVTAHQNTTIVAKFIKLVAASVIAVGPVGSGTVSGAGTYEYGTEVTFTATPGDGYKFTKWIINSVNYDSQSVPLTLYSDVNAVAYFEEIPVRKVFAWTSPSAVVSADLQNIDLDDHIATSVEVRDNDLDESYYVNVPRQQISTADASTYLIVAMPSHFTHGTPDGNNGDFFKTEGPSSNVSNEPDWISTTVEYDNTTYLIVETTGLDTSQQTGSNYPIAFGNVDDKYWADVVESSIEIGISRSQP